MSDVKIGTISPEDHALWRAKLNAPPAAPAIQAHGAARFEIPGLTFEVLPEGLAELAAEAGRCEHTAEELAAAEAEAAGAIESMAAAVDGLMMRYAEAVDDALQPHLRRHAVASLRAEALRVILAPPGQ
jgi:hypothetical protein